MQNFFSNLDQFDLITVVGKDSEKFLQGQLTCDLLALSNPDSCPGCLCDNKGRVIASFTLWKLEDRFYLEMLPGLGEKVLEHLKKYSVFYQTEMSLNSTDFARYAVAGEATWKRLSEYFSASQPEQDRIFAKSGSYLRIVAPEQFQYELWLDPQIPDDESGELFRDLDEQALNCWLLLEQERGIYHLPLEDSGLYTPQELNYDLLGYISFSKGCYTGQEIVARMHYRGKAKKRLHNLEIHSETAPLKHQKIINADGKNIGEILQSFALAPHTYAALAISASVEGENPQLENLPEAELNFRT